MKRLTLSHEERQQLQQWHKHANSHRERVRAHAVLLSGKGYNLEQLADIFEVDRDTISRWLTSWQQHGVAGLSDAPKPGRPPKLDEEAFDLVAQSLQSPPPRLKPRLLEQPKLEQLKKGA